MAEFAYLKNLHQQIRFSAFVSWARHKAMLNKSCAAPASSLWALWALWPLWRVAPPRHRLGMAPRRPTHTKSRAPAMTGSALPHDEDGTGPESQSPTICAVGNGARHHVPGMPLRHSMHGGDGRGHVPMLKAWEPAGGIRVLSGARMNS